MQAIIFLLDAVVSFFCSLFLLRFMMQAMRVSFAGQLGNFVVAITNWAVKPLRRIIPGIAGLDWASLFAAVSPLQIYHAQDIRMYALLEFCQLGYAFCLLKAWGSETNTGKPTWGWWIATVLFGAGAIVSGIQSTAGG